MERKQAFLKTPLNRLVFLGKDGQDGYQCHSKLPFLSEASIGE